MSNDRLTPLDASFLHIEDASQHMHVAAAPLFKGRPPGYEQLLAHIESRLGLVPRYNAQKVGPDRRFTWTRASLDDVKAIKNALGGTVNDGSRG